MFASQFILAGSLLALSAVAPVESQQLHGYKLILAECGILPFPYIPSIGTPSRPSPPPSPPESPPPPESSSTSSSSPEPKSPESKSPESEPPKSSSTTSSSLLPEPSLLLPESCYSTWQDELGTTMLMTHECYTRTSIIPAPSCPKPSCPPPEPDQVCPLYIKRSSVTMPCSTDCCPETTTALEAVGPCEEECDPCHIPTEWVTYMTGCAGGPPTITMTEVVTPTTTTAVVIETETETEEVTPTPTPAPTTTSTTLAF
ncbi:hypothetical protein F5X97DRAFT_320427 [Nemania serpens]|nr:hypothetical protein F5X97DRAFT_320427 [Nemania serpens]